MGMLYTCSDTSLDVPYFCYVLLLFIAGTIAVKIFAIYNDHCINLSSLEIKFSLFF